MLAYLAAENAYFEAAMAPHADLVETLFAGDEGTDQGGRQVGAGQGRRLAALVGVRAGRAVPELVSAGASTGGPDELVFDEPAEAAGKEYLPARRPGDQPGRAAGWR